MVQHDERLTSTGQPKANRVWAWGWLYETTPLIWASAAGFFWLQSNDWLGRMSSALLFTAALSTVVMRVRTRLRRSEPSEPMAELRPQPPGVDSNSRDPRVSAAEPAKAPALEAGHRHELR